MEKIKLRKHRSSVATNSRVRVRNEDTSLEYLMSQHKRLSNSAPKAYVSEQPGSFYLIDNCPVVLDVKNIVTIDCLRKSPNTIFRGRFFVCRSVTPSIYKLNSILTVVQVPDLKMITGGVFLSLGRHFDLLEGKTGVLPYLRAGIIIVVKNPLFFRSISDSVYAVKSDNPADVIFLDNEKFEQLFPGLIFPSELQNEETSLTMRPWWNWWKPIKDWKAIAHMRLQKNNNAGALEAYGLALNMNPQDVKALCLRSKLFFNLKVYRNCLKDTESVLEINSGNREAICYKALAMIGMGKCAEAIEFLEKKIGKCVPIIDSGKKAEFIEIAVKAKYWINHGTFGKNDLTKMLIRASKEIKKNKMKLQYTDPDKPYLNRASSFSTVRCICGCELCKLKEKKVEAVHKRTNEILMEINNLKYDTEVLALIDELEELGGNDPNLATYMVLPMFKLGEIYFEKENFFTAACLFNCVYNLTSETTFNELSMKSCCYAIASHINSKKINKANKLMVILKLNLVKKYGTDSINMLKYEGLDPRIMHSVLEYFQ